MRPVFKNVHNTLPPNTLRMYNFQTAHGAAFGTRNTFVSFVNNVKIHSAYLSASFKLLLLPSRFMKMFYLSCIVPLTGLHQHLETHQGRRGRVHLGGINHDGCWMGMGEGKELRCDLTFCLLYMQ